MIRLVTTFVLFLISASTFATDMNLEGSCKGFEADGTLISFTYFSGFDGCQMKSDAEIIFDEDTTQAGHHTGTRLLQENEDTYSFLVRLNESLKKSLWLVFANSTGNTQGELRYKDANGKITSVILRCEIRDYEYADCL